MATLRSRRARAMGAVAGGLDAINHIVILMLENRSFDHIYGSRKSLDSRIDGPASTASNFADPCAHRNPIAVHRATVTALAFDPPHEFPEVREQVHGPAAC